FSVARDVRAFDLVWTAATAGLLAELGRRWWNARAGLLGALSFALVWSTGIPWWQSAQPDSLVVLPLIAALVLHDAARGRLAWLAGAGLALGFAFQLRFNVALFIPFLP